MEGLLLVRKSDDWNEADSSTLYERKKDGLLSSGGNTCFGSDLKKPIEMVAYDAYTMTQTSIARVGHITRNVSLGQILVTRESTGKGNSVTPLGLAADLEGPVYAAQSPECSIDHQDNMKVGWYNGDSAFLVISADFKNRTQQNVFTKQGGRRWEAKLTALLATLPENSSQPTYPRNKRKMWKTTCFRFAMIPQDTNFDIFSFLYTKLLCQIRSQNLSTLW